MASPGNCTAHLQHLRNPDEIKFTEDAGSWRELISAVFWIILTIKVFTSYGTKQKQKGNEKVPPTITRVASLPIIGPLHHIFAHRKNLPNLMEAWTIKYGDMFASNILGMDIVFMNDPKMIQKLLASHDHVGKADHFYKMFTGVFKNGLPSAPVHAWRHNRNILSEAFKYNTLENQTAISTFYAKKICQDIDQMFDDDDGSKTVKLFEFFSMSSLKVILHLITGSDILSGDSDGIQRFVKLYEKQKEILMQRIQKPWLLAEPIWQIYSVITNRAQVEVELQNFVKELLLKYKNQSCNDHGHGPLSRSLIDVMLQGGYSDDDIFMEIMSFVIAGHDTVGMSLTLLMFNLATNPEHQNICRDEVDKVFQDFSGENKNLPFSSIGNLKYLDRCVKESLRLHPILPIFGRDLTSPLELDDHGQTKLDSGVIVFVSPWMVHRNPRYYPEPHKYNPDRFLPEVCKTRNPYAYIPFSAGPRNCIGWKMALIELKIMAAYVLHNFEILPTESMKSEKFEFSLTVRPQNELRFILKKRRKS